MSDAEDTAEIETSNDLSEEQQSKLIQYQEVTGCEDIEEAKEKLIKFNWNLELAVHDCFGESERVASQDDQTQTTGYLSRWHQSAPESEIEDRGIARSAENTLSYHSRTSWSQWLLNLVLFPYRFTFHVIGDFFTFIARFIWPSFGRYSGDPIQDVLNFKRSFEEHYGLQHPTFYQGSYSQALNDAKKELRFLLIYLHSESHQDTPKFCQDVLSNPGFTEYVNGNMLFWACDVNTHEGYRVSRAVRESAYPFLAVVCLRDNRMTIVWRIEGFIQVDQLIALFARIIDENESALVAARAERAERSMSQTLREEQDRAYQLALEKDREKARRKKELEDEKIREENLRRDKELEKERKLQDIANIKADCRRRLEETTEPESTDPDTIHIRVKLPDGTTFGRRFCTSDEFKVLIDFVQSIEESPREFALNSNFPRKTFQSDINTQATFAEIGITSSTTLFVQSLCEDSSDDE